MSIFHCAHSKGLEFSAICLDVTVDVITSRSWAICMDVSLDVNFLSDLETDRKGSHSWHSRPVLFFWIMYKIYIFHAVRAKILMSFFSMNM